MQALLAALPIGLVVAAMAGLGWRAASAGALGLAAALVLALTVFGLGAETGAAIVLGGAAAEALFTTATILWIILPALCIYESQLASGAFGTMRTGLARITGDKRLQVLLVGWFFALFIEGVAGFGTPVALAAPMLVGLGFSPVKAVTLALIGHAAGVSFGAIGTPVVPQELAGFSGLDLARPAALLHALLGWSLVGLLFVAAGDRRPRLPELRWPALAALFFFAPYLLLAWFAGPELPTLAGALIGGVVFALVVMRTRGADATASEPAPPPSRLLRAALPYLVLLALVLVTRLVPPLKAGLQDIALDWTLFDDFGGRFEPLYHPGTLLLASFLIGGGLQGRSAAELGNALVAALRRLGFVTLALVAMLGLSRLLVHADMIGILAETAALSGGFWPLIAPFIGVLGTFVTGSATASNILFTEFQQATASALSLPAPLLHGAQNFGAAIGNIISPHNIIAGAATVGLAGAREGEVMRTTIAACVLYASAGGMLVWLLARFWG